MATKKSTSNKTKQSKFSWKSGDVQIYKNEAEWRRATSKKSAPKASRKGKK